MSDPETTFVLPSGEYVAADHVASLHVYGETVPLMRDDAWKLAWALVGACVAHSRGAADAALVQKEPND